MPTFRGVVTISHPSLGGIGTNTWHVRTASATVGIDIELGGLSDIINTFYADTGQNRASGTVCAFSGEWAGVGDDEGTYQTTDPWSGAFGSSGSPLPPAICACINWRGESGDRSRRGRTFLGPMSVGVLEDNGTPTAACLASLRLGASNLVESSDSFNNGAIGIWSRQESTFRDVVGSTVRDQFAVLRSRRD